MERSCPVLWIAAEALEVAELPCSPTERAVFWQCAVCERWHGQIVSSAGETSGPDRPVDPRPEPPNQAI